MYICEKCRSENEGDADYCDQCGAPLYKGPGTGDEDDAVRCDCGGAIKETTKGQGVCDSCGARYVDSDYDPAAGNVAPEPGAKETPGQELARRIKEKLASGMPLDPAIEVSCEEFFSGTEDKPESEPCPLCGKENVKGAAMCAGCRILFRGKSVECPRCGEQASGDRCSCGAILTLKKLLEYMEPEVLYVCPKCHQPFEKTIVDCPDCGERVLHADRLKKHASAGSDEA
jgi:DNA-directed RNA polymerase subunit RPC12/RpoP